MSKQTKQPTPPLAAWLQANLAKRGMTQLDLVNASGLSKGHVNAIYRGTGGTDYRISTLMAIAAGLDVQPRTVFDATLPK